jgi:hypothetical protein
VLTGLSAAPQGEQVVLRWQTVNELDVTYFEVYREQEGNLSLVERVLAEFSGQANGKSYEVMDEKPAGSAVYILRIYDINEGSEDQVLGRIGGIQLFLPSVTR